MVPGPGTVTLTKVEKVSPNHCTPSCTIFHEKVYTPPVVGAVAVKVKVAFAPTAIGDEGNATRVKPQVVLSCGFCDPNRKGFAPVFVHGAPPLLFMVIEAVNVWPVLTPAGTLLLTKVALLPPPITIVDTNCAIVPLKISPSPVV